jgi:hypothetical protein
MVAAYWDFVGLDGERSSVGVKMLLSGLRGCGDSVSITLLPPSFINNPGFLLFHVFSFVP